MSPRIATVAFAAMLTLPALAFAQTTRSPGGAPAPATPPAAMAPSTSAAPSTGAPAMTKDIQAKVETHIKQLHTQLKITQAEDSDWNKFADVMRGNASDMQAAMQEREQQYPQMNALQNMESYQKLAETHAEHLQKLVSAFETLYNALPDPQKKVADQVFKARIGSEPRHASTAAPAHNE
jgi:Skp family chaperone for outer membrane proteins